MYDEIFSVIVSSNAHSRDHNGSEIAEIENHLGFAFSAAKQLNACEFSIALNLKTQMH